MLLNGDTECAIRGMIYLAAQVPGDLIRGCDLAEYLDIPLQTLTNVLRKLVKRGVLYSVKGRGGGFSMYPGAEQMSFLEIIEIVDNRLARGDCILKMSACAQMEMCHHHCQWGQLINHEMEYLKRQTIGGISELLFEKTI
ncbi:MAG: RrF2 family transcriptional regulator [Acidithiobacillus sp.]